MNAMVQPHKTLNELISFAKVTRKSNRSITPTTVRNEKPEKNENLEASCGLEFASYRLFSCPSMLLFFTS